MDERDFGNMIPFYHFFGAFVGNLFKLNITLVIECLLYSIKEKSYL